jgi:hypothetical protein
MFSYDWGQLSAKAGHRFGDDGATLLHFEVPTFGSVASELFQQRLLWDDGPKPEATAFELLVPALHDVAARRTESNSFDPGMLHRIRTYHRILTRGINRNTMPDTVAEKLPFRVPTPVGGPGTGTPLRIAARNKPAPLWRPDAEL